VSEKKFYVYEHWRPDEDVIFYVGKGQKRRAWDTHRGRNPWHKFIVAKLKRVGTPHEVRVVEYFDNEEEAFRRESELISYWKSLGAELVNLTEGGEGPSGRKHTEEWKQSLRVRMKGRRPSAETRAKMSAAAMGNQKGRGQKRSQTAIDAVTAFHTGRKRSPETCAKIKAVKSAAPSFLGKRHTPETIEKISAKQRGIPKSEETKARMRKPKSEEHKQKLRDLNFGKTHSAETRAKIAENTRAMWARRNLEKPQGNQ